MKFIFDHIFYRTYYWNLYVVKEKDFPVFSSFLTVSALMGININCIIISFLVFVIKNIQIYPDWGFWIIMLLSMTPNYFLFIHNKKYKSILLASAEMNKSEKRKRDVAIFIYILITILIAVFVSLSSRDLKIQQGLLIN